MTDTGKRQEIGETGEELASLRSRLLCLVAKAEICQGSCRDAANQLKRAIGDEKTGNSQGECKRETWPSYDDIVSLFNNINEAKSRIVQLEDRLRGWGVIR